MGDEGSQRADGLEALVRLVEELRAERDEDRALLDELMARLAERESPLRRRVYDDWPAWVDDWLSPRLSRSPHRYRWCHRYAEHPEVALRLEALWHAWEAQWPHPVERLGWLRDGLDHQLPYLTAEDGPLRDCSALENVHVLSATFASLGR